MPQTKPIPPKRTTPLTFTLVLPNLGQALNDLMEHIQNLGTITALRSSIFSGLQLSFNTVEEPTDRPQPSEMLTSPAQTPGRPRNLGPTL